MKHIVYLCLLSFLSIPIIGCGGLSVDRISLSDPRLPVDARQWVADAEDAVVVSNARLAETKRNVQDVVKSQSATLAGQPFTGAQGPQVQLRRDQMGLARVEATKAAYELAKAEVELSKKRLMLVYAETAMRHDIDIYNMPPLQAAVDNALKAVITRRNRHRMARNAELKATDDWWKAWQEYVRAKSDTRPFWTTGE